MCFGLAIKFPGADGYLAHARAPGARLTLEPTRLASFVCFASFLLLFWEERLRRKRASKSGGTLASHRPDFGSSVWQVPLGARGTPCAPGGHAGRDASRPAARPQSSGRLEREEKGRTGRPVAPRDCAPACSRAPRACTLRAPAHLCVCAPGVQRHVFWRATGTSCGVQPARLAVCNRHVLRRATGTSCGVQPARLAARNRHVLRRATGTSLRRVFCAVRRTPTRARARDLERVITTLRLSVRLRARFAISRRVSLLNLLPDMLCIKGLQGQKGVSLLVGIWVRRALLVPRINRGSTACQPLILFPHSRTCFA